MPSNAFRSASAGSTSSSGTISARSPSSAASSPRDAVCLAEELVLGDPADDRLRRARPVGERPLDQRRDRVEQREGKRHDLVGHAVRVAQLLHFRIGGAGQVATTSSQLS